MSRFQTRLCSLLCLLMFSSQVLAAALLDCCPVMQDGEHSGHGSVLHDDHASHDRHENYDSHAKHAAHAHTQHQSHHQQQQAHGSVHDSHKSQEPVPAGAELAGHTHSDCGHLCDFCLGTSSLLLNGGLALLPAPEMPDTYHYLAKQADFSPNSPFKPPIFV